MAVRVHFFHRHVQDTAIILEELKLPHPLCPQCNMLVNWRALNGMQLAISQCINEAERKCRQLAEEDLQEILERDFQAYRETLETVTLFKYLGQVLTKGGENWTAVAGNLRKPHNSWTWMTSILGREGVDLRMSGLFLKAVSQAVLLLVLET